MRRMISDARRKLTPYLTLVVSAATAAAPTGAQSGTPDSSATGWTYESQSARFRVEVVATGFQRPSGLSFLPDGRLLVADRPAGTLSAIDVGSGVVTRIGGVPPVHAKVDGGLLDVLVHPDYTRNGWIYLAYAAELPEGNTTVVDRARLDGDRLVGIERLFAARPAIPNDNHFGCRLVLDRGFLFISLGDRDTRELAQDVASDDGKIIRLREDGTVPRDNPFVKRKGALPEIWSYGHRNPQGLALHPETRELWEDEHGPKGGDEINVIQRGRNYGWPVITYGREYDGRPVGDGRTRQAGMEQPLYYYVPSIAPSGMLFYTGTAFPGWRGNLFIGAMALTHLNRLVADGGRILHEERLLDDRQWRVRVVQQGPDGFIYIGVDSGMVLRLRPVEG
jgi:aldose sugar dehydrogenase